MANFGQMPGNWGSSPGAQPNWGGTQTQPTAAGMPMNYSQPAPPAPFTGRFIDNLSDIVPNEVPMDGRPALFPTRSLEEIYLKMWNANGEVKTFRYVLDLSQNFNAPPPPPDNTQAEILARLEQLEKQVSDSAAKTGQNRGTKGGDK